MTEKTCKTVRLVYGILLGVMSVILGALFIWQTLDIYISGTAADYEGTYAFTRERVGAGLLKISPAFWIWVVMIIGGFVLWEVFPVAEKRKKADVRYSLYRLKKRMPATVDGELKDSFAYVKGEEDNLRILWLFAAALGVAGSVYAIVYLSNPAHFPKVDVTAEMLNMVKHIMPWVLAVFAVACAICVYEGQSAKRQLEHAKKLAALNKPAEAVHGKIYYLLKHKYFLLGVRIAVGCLGAAFVIAGICNGSMRDVLIKAINICTECIGLG